MGFLWAVKYTGERVKEESNDQNSEGQGSAHTGRQWSGLTTTQLMFDSIYSIFNIGEVCLPRRSVLEILTTTQRLLGRTLEVPVGLV